MAGQPDKHNSLHFTETHMTQWYGSKINNECCLSAMYHLKLISEVARQELDGLPSMGQ